MGGLFLAYVSLWSRVEGVQRKSFGEVGVWNQWVSVTLSARVSRGESTGTISRNVGAREIQYRGRTGCVAIFRYKC